MYLFNRVLAAITALLGASTPTPAGVTTQVNPQNILFSVPTLNDALPDTFAETAPSSSTIIIHEDDWRQFEFVSASFKPLIDQELADIDAIWKTKSVKSDQYTAFHSIHIRKRIPDPFAKPIPAAGLTSLFPAAPSSFTFRDRPQILKDVVAWRTAGIIFYATIHENAAYTFGIQLEAKPSLDHDTSARITQFMKDHDLLLIHWPSRTVLDSSASVESFLEGRKIN